MHRSKCHQCGKPTHSLWLDGKPRLFRGWVWRNTPKWIALRLLAWAADRGWEFDRLECIWCYGPGYQAPMRALNDDD
jgi:hypothetical protein